jgi:hypothetical protein
MDPSQSPQQPSYPTYPSYPTPAYGMPQAAPAVAMPAPTPKKGGAGRIIAVVLVLVVAAVAVLGYLHYNGPIDTVKGYFNNTFVTFDGTAAYNSICSDAKDRPTSVAAMQQEIDQAKAVGTFDISKITYSLASENFFSDASVKLGGTITVKTTAGGQVGPTSLPVSGTFGLKSTGFGWCLESGQVNDSGA